MIKRDKYLNILKESKDLNLIKVITGVRRSGKSVLLMQYKDYLISQGVKDENIIYINFESAEFFDIQNYKQLNEYVKEKYNSRKNKKKMYVMLDEVQRVESWEKTVNAFLVDLDVDIYITGSNAYLLSSELATLLSGRILTINVFPFSFNEYILAKKDNNEEVSNIDEVFDEYLKWGGMPQMKLFKQNDMLRSRYLKDITDVVLKNDVIARNNIKDPVFLDNLLKYMASVIGNLTTPNGIAEFMRKNGKKVSNETVDSYLKMFENAYILYRTPRFELRGKELLKTQGKYYFVDNGIKNNIDGIDNYFSGSSLENVVYIELLRRGYEVYVGKYDSLEIDFVAIKPDKKIYIQVSRTIMDEKVEEREKKSLLFINDNYQKIILTMDKNGKKVIEGIDVVYIPDFLTNEKDY